MYQIIRTPIEGATGKAVPLPDIDDYRKIQEEGRLEELNAKRVIIYERQTLDEIKDCLQKIADNPHAVTVEWDKGRRAINAARADGRQFRFRIVKK